MDDRLDYESILQKHDVKKTRRVNRGKNIRFKKDINKSKKKYPSIRKIERDIIAMNNSISGLFLPRVIRNKQRSGDISKKNKQEDIYWNKNKKPLHSPISKNRRGKIRKNKIPKGGPA